MAEGLQGEWFPSPVIVDSDSGDKFLCFLPLEKCPLFATKDLASFSRQAWRRELCLMGPLVLFFFFLPISLFWLPRIAWSSWARDRI